jgi:trans-aconitate methyltransferase
MTASRDAAAGGPGREDPGGRAEPPGFDTSIAHPARVYDYLLGGKDNYAADREAAQEFAAAMPSILPGVQANRTFLRRAVEYLAGEAGIRQFLDIGTGLPTAYNTHQVAQSIAPEARVVYVDNDPIVLAHARALLTSTPQGATDYLDADAREPAKILREAARTLDLSQPVAVMMLLVLHFIPDSDGPHQIVAELMDALPSGSYLAVSDATTDIDTERVTGATAQYNARTGPTRSSPRTRADIARYFTGLEFVEPGLVPVAQWSAVAPPMAIPAYAGIARKP